MISSMYWLLSFLIIHQMRLSVEKEGLTKVENSLAVFAILNFLVCVIQMILVMKVTHALNPYKAKIIAPDIRFPNILHPYEQSSGDHIRGIFNYDNHYNAIVSQFLLLFFLFRKRYLLSFLNLLIVCAVCYNLVTLLLFMILGLSIFIFSGWQAKLIVSGFMLYIVAFYAFVTPENVAYLTSRIRNSIYSLKGDNSKIHVDTAKPVVVTIQQASAVPARDKEQNAEPQTSVDAGKQNNETQKHDTIVVNAPDKKGSVLKFGSENSTYVFDKVSGKRISYGQTLAFLKGNHLYAVIGSGAGTFSSKLASNLSGVYGPTMLNKKLPRPSYDVYYENHGAIITNLQKIEIGYHSINNFPNSVYNQLLSEYGLLGMALFFVFYVWYFLKKYRKFTFTLFTLPLLLIYFNYGYQFETLDVVVFFELLFFCDIYSKRFQAEQ